MSTITPDSAPRAANRLEATLTATGERFDVFVGCGVRQGAFEPSRYLADNKLASATTAFSRPDADIISAAIPAFFIGRNRDGFWVARDARGRVGGLFLRKASAVSFARAQSKPAGCATIFPNDRFELDLENSGNPLVPSLRPLLRLAMRLGTADAHLAMVKRFCLIGLTVLLALCAAGGVIALKTAAYLSHFTH
jgi:hypothetical protein